jgi:CubicO group peptidase (beta-lactamase class C family)
VRRISVILAGLLILAACSPGLQAGSTIDDGFPESLATDLTRRLAGSWAEGFQVAVVLEDGSTWTYQEEPGTSDPYPADVGSIGKTMEAALVLRLTEEGVIDLDDPADRWIVAPSGVTIRHLLQHTSGIASDDRKLPPVCAPGTCQSYSNDGYEMVAELVAAVTGQSNEDNLRTRIFEPLGLTDATVTSEEIVYTARGLARFAQSLYRGDLVTSSSLERMLDFESVLGLPGSNECETMGLGTVRRYAEGLGESWGHGGWTSQSRSWMEYFPESGVSFAVIVNGGADFLPLGPIYDALGSHFPESPTPLPCDHDVAQLLGDEGSLLASRPGFDGQPALSPDGSTLAYLSVFDDGIDMVLRDVATGEEARLVLDGWEVVPRWSSNSHLVYSSDLDGDREIYLRDVDSGATTQLTDDDVDDHLASFSPDGSQIVFVRGWSGEEGLWLMEADGTDQHRIDGSHDQAWWPAWSPDGAQVAYDSGGGLFIIDAGGGQPSRVPIEQIKVVVNPSWAPGSDLLFSADGDLWSVAADGTGLNRLTSTSSVEETPVWGRDGSIFYQVWHLTDSGP